MAVKEQRGSESSPVECLVEEVTEEILRNQILDSLCDSITSITDIAEMSISSSQPIPRYSNCPHQACALLQLSTLSEGLREASNLWKQGNVKEVRAVIPFIVPFPDPMSFYTSDTFNTHIRALITT